MATIGAHELAPLKGIRYVTPPEGALLSARDGRVEGVDLRAPAGVQAHDGREGEFRARIRRRPEQGDEPRPLRPEASLARHPERRQRERQRRFRASRAAPALLRRLHEPPAWRTVCRGRPEKSAHGPGLAGVPP